ncbi:urease accessory protein UreD [Actibacterium sp. 188UL27-1]|nr:urease accessory protein UreD [Actibacterium sp. 188UL27-1]
MPRPVGRMQRVDGRAEVGLVRGSGRTRLAHLHQAGSAKAMLPRCHGTSPEVVLLNTAGGVTGGDRLRYAIDVGPGAIATATTQTAERAYGTKNGVAKVNIDLMVGKGGHLDWLPQETILFDTANLYRRTRIDLSTDATLLYSEALILGRAAMGEAVRSLSLIDRRDITRNGKPLLIDPVRLDGAMISAPGQCALLSGCRALATVVLIAPDAEDAVGQIRALPGIDGVTIGSSAWEGKCVIRLMAVDAWPMRRALVRLLTQLRGGPLPRVWQI